MSPKPEHNRHFFKATEFCSGWLLDRVGSKTLERRLVPQRREERELVREELVVQLTRTNREGLKLQSLHSLHARPRLELVHTPALVASINVQMYTYQNNYEGKVGPLAYNGFMNLTFLSVRPGPLNFAS